jgi:hypothetical protein
MMSGLHVGAVLRVIIHADEHPKLPSMREEIIRCNAMVLINSQLTRPTQSYAWYAL